MFDEIYTIIWIRYLWYGTKLLLILIWNDVQLTYTGSSASSYVLNLAKLKQLLLRTFLSSSLLVCTYLYVCSTYLVYSILLFVIHIIYYHPTGPEQSGQAGAGAVANIRPKPRIAWHRRPLFSPGLDGDQLQVENLDGPGSEEWTFRESTHSQSVRIQYLLKLWVSP